MSASAGGVEDGNLTLREVGDADSDLLAGAGVPYPGGAVVPGGGQSGAVGGPGHGVHRAGVAGEGGERPAGGGAPQPGGAVTAGGGQRVPSGDQATAFTGSLWPVRVASCVRVAGFHSRTVPPSPAVARRVASGDQATARTQPTGKAVSLRR